MVATFWPTVGTVLRLGCEGVYVPFICSRRVVLPALSRPRRRTEYSVVIVLAEDGKRKVGRKLSIWERGMTDGGVTFFTCCV